MRSRIACSASTPDLIRHGSFDDRIESGVEQALHERIRRVVRTRCLPPVAGELREREVSPAAVHLRRQCQQTLVYAAQLLGAEIVVVHGTEHLVLAGIGEMTQRFEEVVVGQLSVVQRGSRCRIPEKTAERRERQVPARRGRPSITGERSDERPELAPEVDVARTLDPSGQPP